MVYYKNIPHKKNKVYTKKSGGSEVLNSSLTKKSLPLQNYHISKGGYIKEVNKNSKHSKQNINSKHNKSNSHKKVKKYTKYVNPNYNTAENVLEGGEFDLDKKLDVASQDTFAVSNAIDYKLLRFKIKIQKIGANKFQKCLLDVHKYLARVNLDYIKLFTVITKLVGEGEIDKKKKKRIAKIQQMINDIVELEKYLHSSGDYVPVALSDFEGDKLLKSMASKYTGGKSKLSRVFVDKYNSKRLNQPLIIYYVTKLQDKIREKIKKLSLFDNTGDLGTACGKGTKGKRIALKSVGVGFFTGKDTKNRNKLLCPLGKFRKREAKFNKHYIKFTLYYKKFLKLIQCEAKDKFNLETLDIYSDNKKEFNISAMRDPALCNQAKAVNDYDKHASGFSGLPMAKRFEKTKMFKDIKKRNPAKLKEYESKMKTATTNFSTIFKEMEKSLKFIKQNMKNLESTYCIRLYQYNLPAKKGFWKSLVGTFSRDKTIFVKQKTIDRLVKEPLFIDNFEKLIRGLDDERKKITTPETVKALKEALNTVLKPDDKEFIDDKGERLKVIPNVLITERITKESLTIETINFVNNTTNNEFYESITQPAHNIHIICAQNCNKEMLKHHIFTTTDAPDPDTDQVSNKITFIPIAFSGYSKINNENTKFNIIFIREDIIHTLSYKKQGGIDQTDYFQLDIAQGMDPKYSRSFAAVNIFFESDANISATDRTELQRQNTEERQEETNNIVVLDINQNTISNFDDLYTKWETITNPTKKKQSASKILKKIKFEDITDYKNNIIELLGQSNDKNSDIGSIVNLFNTKFDNWKYINGQAMADILGTLTYDDKKEPHIASIVETFKTNVNKWNTQNGQAMAEILGTLSDDDKKEPHIASIVNVFNTNFDGWNSQNGQAMDEILNTLNDDKKEPYIASIVKKMTDFIKTLNIKKGALKNVDLQNIADEAIEAATTIALTDSLVEAIKLRQQADYIIKICIICDTYIKTITDAAAKATDEAEAAQKATKAAQKANKAATTATTAATAKTMAAKAKTMAATAKMMAATATKVITDATAATTAATTAAATTATATTTAAESVVTKIKTVGDKAGTEAALAAAEAAKAAKAAETAAATIIAGTPAPAPALTTGTSVAPTTAGTTAGTTSTSTPTTAPALTTTVTSAPITVVPTTAPETDEEKQKKVVEEAETKVKEAQLKYNGTQNETNAKNFKTLVDKFMEEIKKYKKIVDSSTSIGQADKNALDAIVNSFTANATALAGEAVTAVSVSTPLILDGGALPNQFPPTCLRIVSTELISLDDEENADPNNSTKHNYFDIEMIKKANTYKNESGSKSLRSAQYDKIKELVKNYTGAEPDIIAGNFGGFFYKMGDNVKTIEFLDNSTIIDAIYALVLLYIWVYFYNKKDNTSELVYEQLMNQNLHYLKNNNYIKEKFDVLNKQYTIDFKECVITSNATINLINHIITTDYDPYMTKYNNKNKIIELFKNEYSKEYKNVNQTSAEPTNSDAEIIIDIKLTKPSLTIKALSYGLVKNLLESDLIKYNNYEIQETKDLMETPLTNQTKTPIEIVNLLTNDDTDTTFHNYLLLFKKQNIIEPIKTEFKKEIKKHNDVINNYYNKHLKSKLKDPSDDNLHYVLEFLSIGDDFTEYKHKLLYELTPSSPPSTPSTSTSPPAPPKLDKTKLDRVINTMKSKPLTTAVLIKTEGAESIEPKIKILDDRVNPPVKHADDYVYSAPFTPGNITLDTYNDTDQPIYRSNFKKPVLPDYTFDYSPSLTLYTKKNLQELMLLLDKYQSVFTLGYKPYLKRDLGCFSLLDESFGFRKQDDLNILYTLNNPGFIESYLNKFSGFFNISTSGDEKKFYSENQILRGLDTKLPSFNMATTLFYNIDNPSNPVYNRLFTDTTISKTQKQCVRDVIMRMLLIPTKDLIEITDVKNIRNTEKPNKQSNSTTKGDPTSSNETSSSISTESYYNPVHYVQLAQTFTLKFYRNKALPKLLNRLNDIVNVKYDNPAVSGESKKMVVPENFIDVLLKRNQQGNYINLGNRALIANFYEFIFIMLKIKYIDHQIENLSGLKTEDVIMAELRQTESATKTVGGSLHNSRRFLTFNSSQKHITPKQHIKEKKQNGSQLHLKTKKKNRKTKTKHDKQESISQTNSHTKMINHKRTKHALKL